jgi:hypothetical protein
MWMRRDRHGDDIAPTNVLLLGPENQGGKGGQKQR